jgi:hypothetical protein
MASQGKQWTDKCPLGAPAKWIADGHVTCNIQCSGKCDRRMVDIRLDTLPQEICLGRQSAGALSTSNVAPRVL